MLKLWADTCALFNIQRTRKNEIERGKNKEKQMKSQNEKYQSTT